MEDTKKTKPSESTKQIAYKLTENEEKCRDGMGLQQFLYIYTAVFSSVFL